MFLVINDFNYVQVTQELCISLPICMCIYDAAEICIVMIFFQANLLIFWFDPDYDYDERKEKEINRNWDTIM